MSNDETPDFNIGDDYFSIFSLPRGYDIARAALKPVYIQLQQSVHPDRFVNADEMLQNLAVKKTAYLNQAYDTLKSPVKTAIYVLELAAVDLNLDSETTVDVPFLQMQLEMREALSEVDQQDDPWEKLDELSAAAKSDATLFQNEFSLRYQEQAWPEAIQVINKLMFVDKFLQEVKHKAEMLEN